MKNQAGNPVRREDYFIRKNLINKAWDLLESGNHILIAAPRRVGKTSLMFYLMDHLKNGYHFVYLDTESVNNENEFYRRLINKIIVTDHIQRSQKVLTFLKEHMPTVKKLGPDGIEFGVSEPHNYYEMLIKILKECDLQNNKLIIMLDEYPQTLENIIQDSGENPGKHFLQTNRELRHELSEILKNIQFIYTGSVGLENIVSKLNSIGTINDLSRLKIPPLKIEEATHMIRLLLERLNFSLSDDNINYILNKIEWLIPFYIQLIIQEIKDLHQDEGLEQVTEANINQAIANMLEQRHHFEHWHTRLRNSFKGDEYNFVKELLNIISENDKISSSEILNIAAKYHMENKYKDIAGSLVYDGYINNNDDNKIYRYNSPILRMWWRQNVAN